MVINFSHALCLNSNTASMLILSAASVIVGALPCFELTWQSKWLFSALKTKNLKRLIRIVPPCSRLIFLLDFFSKVKMTIGKSISF